jgi:hypothetical protein
LAGPAIADSGAVRDTVMHLLRIAASRAAVSRRKTGF